MTKSDMALIESLESGHSHALCFLSKEQKRLIKKVFGVDNIGIRIDDLNRVYVKKGAVAVIE